MKRNAAALVLAALFALNACAIAGTIERPYEKRKDTEIVGDIEVLVNDTDKEEPELTPYGKNSKAKLLLGFKGSGRMNRKSAWINDPRDLHNAASEHGPKIALLALKNLLETRTRYRTDRFKAAHVRETIVRSE